MKISLNDKVRAKITPHGKTLILESVHDFNTFLKNRYAPEKPPYTHDLPQYDADDVIEIQLWLLLRYFEGSHYSIGKECPFEWIESI
jgi:hypothetical protein